MEFRQPLAVLDVGLASAYVVHVAGVDQHYLDAVRLKDFVDRDPVDPGRFERHGLDPALHQPVGQALEVGGEGLNSRTAMGSRSRGTATKWLLAPQSMPAASGCMRSSSAGPRMPALLVAELAPGSLT